MDNPQDIKKAILSVLAEKGDYKTLLQHIEEPDLKKKVLSVLVEKGDYNAVLDALNDEEKKKNTTEVFSKIAPILQFSEMITKDARGTYMEELQGILDEKTSTNLTQLTAEIAALKTQLEKAVADLLDVTKKEIKNENLAFIQVKEAELSEKLFALAVEVVSSKASEMFAELGEQARLSEDEIEEIIEASALSVESQISLIIGEYMAAQKITTEQIVDFEKKVTELIPKLDFSNLTIEWRNVRGAPSVGGTNTHIIKRMIDAALEDFTGGTGSGVTVETPTGTVDATNTSFTVTAEPKWIVSDGITYFAGAGYTYADLSITMDVPPSQFIRAII